jgi:hypothetical protein
MITGWPKPPTFLSIILGIGLAIVLILAFFHIPEVVKYTGAVLMYVPSRLGFFEMVTPSDVIPVSIARAQTPVYLPEAGSYAMYTENYDLLTLHNAAVESGKLTWIKVHSQDTGERIAVHMVTRGLTLYDTPFAKGRPIVTFLVAQPGNYVITHPSRPDSVYLVRDEFTGRESRISTILLVEVGLVAGSIFVFLRRRSAPRRLQKKAIQEQARKRAEEQRRKMEKMKKIEGEHGSADVVDEYEPDNYWKKSNKP